MSGDAAIDRRSDPDVLRHLLSMDPKHANNELARLSSERFAALAGNVLTQQRTQRKERNLQWYVPVNENSMAAHLATESTVCLGGGNRSSKTETVMSEFAQCTTGIFSNALRKRFEEEGRDIVKEKFRGPIDVRVVCESLTTVLHQTILSKLQWWKWTGSSEPGGDMGHWGWIPRDCLIGDTWDRSWSEKLRTLRVLCRDPETYKVVGESTWQFMSKDQDASDFASGQFHMILHDEPPSLAIWTENEARTISVAGRMFLAMTWPDDPSIPVDWIFDKLYDPAGKGEKDIKWINLWMTQNPHIDQEAVEKQRAKWDQQTQSVRVFGHPIRFSNLIHSLFTDQDDGWCFRCGKTCIPTEDTPPRCGACDSGTISIFNHVREFEVIPALPCIFVLDPHPRKPHMYQWWQIDSADDLWLVAEGELDSDPEGVRDHVYDIERSFHLNVTRRLIDPNMGRSPSSSTRRHVTWQDDFDGVGLVTDLADDSEVGRSRINEYLKPDRDTLSPRIHIHPRCTKTIMQMKRYVWDSHRAGADREVKQKPKDKNDDHPTMMKYLLNSDPSFDSLQGSHEIFRRREIPQQRREALYR